MVGLLVPKQPRQRIRLFEDKQPCLTGNYTWQTGLVDASPEEVCQYCRSGFTPRYHPIFQSRRKAAPTQAIDLGTPFLPRPSMAARTAGAVLRLGDANADALESLAPEKLRFIWLGFSVESHS